MIRIRMRNPKYSVLLLLLSIFCVTTETRAEGASARYLENNGAGSLLELTIENPAPSSVIVKQYVPLGTRIANTTPSYRKFAAKKGVITWLFKHPTPGVKHIRMTYSAAISSGRVTAVVRCKSPSSGQLLTITVQ